MWQREEVLLDLFCACAPGLEPLLAAEVRGLGLAVEERPGGVAVRGDGDALVRLNLRLRTASRVLLRLGAFEAQAFPQLRRRAGELPFEQVLRPGGPVALRVTCRKSRLFHSGAVAERVHAAIEARLGARCELRKPSAAAADEEGDGGGEAEGDAAGPAQLLLVRFDRDRCTVSADSSGALLHRRGWRTHVSQAPLRETLAAALLLAAGYQGGPLLDPCCGAGTLPIEAALIALGRAPGLARAFAFERWPGHDPARTAAERERARAQERPGADGPIEGSDLDPRAIDAARANAERAGVAGQVRFSIRPLQQLEAPRDASGARCAAGLLAANPPYGKRVGEGSDLPALYASLGAAARARLPGWAAALVCPDPRLAESAGLQLRRRLQTQSGGLRVGFFLSAAQPRS